MGSEKMLTCLESNKRYADLFGNFLQQTILNKELCFSVFVVLDFLFVCFIFFLNGDFNFS